MKYVEGTRSGQLMVYIPDLGGVKTNDSDHIMVSYASPFFGHTYGTDSQTGSVNGADGQWTSGMSYGMWFVPPDLGNKVLVTFVAGDRSRGYWFACVYDSPSHHMVPGLGRNIGGESDTVPTVSDGSYRPVVEAYSGEPNALVDITTTPRYAHEFQTNNLIVEGLDRDPIRGAISSSSLREAPSNVYGVSTPGRPVTDTNQVVVARYGGHQFVMDDGDANGTDQLIRLRTAGGHQLMLNDSSNIVYIASKTGTQWLEFSDNGSINVYGLGGVNIRTEGVLNLQGDAGVIISTLGELKLNADIGIKLTTKNEITALASSKILVATDGALSVSAGGTCSVASSGAMNIGSSSDVNINGTTVNLNNGSAPAVNPASFSNGSLPDVTNNGTLWVMTGTLETACTVAPAHEPWVTDPATGARPK